MALSVANGDRVGYRGLRYTVIDRRCVAGVDEALLDSGCSSCEPMWVAVESVDALRSMRDPVNSPPHYTQHPSGVECCDIAEHFNFCVGNAIKYLWRAGLKGDAIEDLKKAAWFVQREIKRREKEAGT